MLTSMILLTTLHQLSAADLVKQIESIQEPVLKETTAEAIAKWEADCDKVADNQGELVWKLYSHFPSDPSVPTWLGRRWNGMVGRRKPCDTSRLDRLENDIKSFVAKPQLPQNRQMADFWVARSTVWRQWRTTLDAKPKMDDAAQKPLIESSLKACDAFQKKYPKDESGAYLYYDFTSMVKNSKDEIPGLQRMVQHYPETRLGKSSKGRLKSLTTLGKPFELSFTDVLTGKKVDIKDYRGQVVLVDFWATWCNPCRLDIEKNMLRLAPTWKERGLAIVGISVDVSEKDGGRKMLLDYIQDKKIPWPNYYSGKTVDDGPAGDWGVTSFPTQFLVDRKGRLRYMDTSKGRDQLIEELLAEK